MSQKNQKQNKNNKKSFKEEIQMEGHMQMILR